MTDPRAQELHPRITQRPTSGVNFGGTGALYIAARSDHNHLALEVDWAAVPWNTNWTDFGASYQTVQYCLDASGWVVVRGVGLWTGTGVPIVNTVLFTFPVEFRPPADLVFGSTMSAGVGRLDVRSSGDCVYQTGLTATNQFMTFSNFRFKPS